MTDGQASKAELRRRLKGERDGIAIAQRTQWSDAIGRAVAAFPQVAAADSVFCYVSLGSEVDTHDLIRRLLAAGKRVAVPRLTGPGEMIAQAITSLDDLKPGLYGFLQPPPAVEAREVACGVALVPGLAFTRAGDRLGYGAGHYDRYFARHGDTFAIGLCFEQQVAEALPTEAHDRCMGAIVTERLAALC